jgi:hypothetical protein
MGLDKIIMVTAATISVGLSILESKLCRDMAEAEAGTKYMKEALPVCVKIVMMNSKGEEKFIYYRRQILEDPLVRGTDGRSEHLWRAHFVQRTDPPASRHEQTTTYHTHK